MCVHKLCVLGVSDLGGCGVDASYVAVAEVVRTLIGIEFIDRNFTPVLVSVHRVLQLYILTCNLLEC